MSKKSSPQYWIDKLDDAKDALGDSIFNKDQKDFENALSDIRNACDRMEEFRSVDSANHTFTPPPKVFEESP